MALRACRERGHDERRSRDSSAQAAADDRGLRRRLRGGSAIDAAAIRDERRVASAPATRAGGRRRSVLSAALITFACFVHRLGRRISSRSVRHVARSPASGTGGFVLMAESVAPLMHNPNTASGRAGARRSPPIRCSIGCACLAISTPTRRRSELSHAVSAAKSAHRRARGGVPRRSGDSRFARVAGLDAGRARQPVAPARAALRRRRDPRDRRSDDADLRVSFEGG